MIEEETRTPLSDTLRRLLLQAGETNLLCSQDVKALQYLAQLNQAQQQAGQTAPGSTERAQAETQFSDAYTWLHQLHNYPVHQDHQTGIWRLGTFIGRKEP